MKNLKISRVSKYFLYALLCNVFLSLNLKFEVTQYTWGRKLFGGTFYLIETRGLRLSKNPFWSDKEITSCQSQTLGIERYEKYIA